MDYFDSKVLESFIIPEDSIVTEGFGSKVVNFIKMIFKSIGRFFKIIGNTFINLIKKMRASNKGRWKTETSWARASNALVREINNGIINKPKVISAIEYIDKKFPDNFNNSYTPNRIDKSKWNKEYLNELENLFYHGADSKAMIIYMAEVHLLKNFVSLKKSFLFSCQLQFRRFRLPREH